MFGNVPKEMWKNWVGLDEQNRIDLACRALLVDDEGKKILFETGVGAFFEPKLKERFGINENEHVLLNSLKAIGLTDADIDVVVLSHLHFDHAGGLLSQWKEGKEPELLFPNAQYLVSKDHYLRAQKPHFRDRASFLPELNQLLEQSGRLQLVETQHSDLLGKDYRFIFSSGHTPSMMLTEIQTEKGPIVFAADLIPGTPWMHLPITMGYDRFPEALIDEKQSLLVELVNNQGYVFFTHDPDTALAKVHKNEKGRFSATELNANLVGVKY